MRILNASVSDSKDKVLIQGENGMYTITGKELEEYLIQDGQMCEDCGDTGEIIYDVQDSDGNWERGTGSKPCHCQKRIQEDHDD
jgi:hypothetical protein